MSRLVLLISFMVLVLGATLSQEEFSLRASAVDFDNEEVIKGVSIYHHSSNKIIQSDIKGLLIVDGLITGNHYFTLYTEGYQSYTDSIFINKNTSHTFYLKPLSQELSTIDIIAEKKELFAVRQLKDIEETSIYAGKKTEVVILDLVKGNLAINNGRQVYAQVAGLNIYEGNDGGIQLNIGGRGLDPNRTSNFNTRQNNYDISADLLGYPESYYTPPAEALSEIKIVRGASSLQYGTQFGGLIDFKIRKTPRFKNLEITSNQTVGSYGLLNTFNAIGWNKGKSAINGFYNYKQGNGYRANAAYKAHTAFLSYDYHLSEKTKIGAEFTYFTYLAKQAGGLTDQQFMINPRQSTRDRNWFKVDWRLFNFNVKHKISDHSKLSLSIFGLDADRKSVGYRGNPIDLNENPITSLDEQDQNGNYINPRDLILGKFKNHGAELKYLNRYRLSGTKAVFLIGTKYYKANNTAIQGAGTSNEDADFSLVTSDFPDYANQSSFLFPNRNVSIFSENIFYVSEKFSIIPGIRLEHIRTQAEGNYNQVVFDNAGNAIANNELSDKRDFTRNFALLGLGMSYKNSDQLQLIGNISQNYRSVTFSDIRVVSPTFIVDPDITDEKGFTMDLGVKGKIRKVLSYDLTVYSVFYQDRIGIILNNRANRERKNIGTALIAGTESLVNVNLARWIVPDRRDYQLNIYLNTAYTFSQYLQSQLSNVVGKKVEFIPTINLKSGVSLRYKKLECTYQFSFLSKQFTDVQNSPLSISEDKKSGITGPIPAYHISDFTLSYYSGGLKFTGGVNNLMDRAYFTRRATGYPGPGIIPSDGRSFFVTIGYRFER